MKAVKAFSSILFMALMAVALTSVTGAPLPVTFTGLVAVSFIPMPKGASFMALQKEIWESDIIGNLFKGNEFANRAYNADQHVLGGKVVHMPVAGANTQVKKNLTTFPQTAVNRTDSELTYALDTYYALPRQVQEIEKYELSYDKRQSVVGDDEMQLIETAMEGLLYRWAPAGTNSATTTKVFETTGPDSGDDLLESATGTRKLFTKAEFKKIAKKLANSKIKGRITALLTANHYHQFFESLSDAEKTNFNNVADLANGIVGKYMGIEIMMRQSVLRYRKSGAIWTVVDDQDEAFAAGTGDSAASLFWIDSCVARAKGDIKVFEDNGNPLYYGDVFSALVRLGGRIRRTGGVYAVVEAIGA